MKERSFCGIIDTEPRKKESMLINKNPKFPCKSTGRTQRFAFNWIGGGYNDVWARNAAHAVEFAEAAYNVGSKLLADGSAMEFHEDHGGMVKKGPKFLRVDVASVRLITDHKNYDNSSILLD